MYAMKTVSLASGSKGNAYYIESEKAKILLDIGLCYKDLQKKLESLKVDINSLNAILITHEHSDHIKGLEAFIKNNTNAKIFIHNEDVNAVNEKVKCGLNNVTTITHEPFIFKDIEIKSFKLSHDSKYCCGYSLKDSVSKVSFLTDTGCFDQTILNNIIGSNLVYLEANHDVDTLLNNINYPAKLKQRILSNKGHLSNDSAEKIIEFLAINNTQQIVLSHLSEQNNSPSLAYNYIKNKLNSVGIIEGKNIFIDVATQNNIGTIFNIK